MRGARKCHSRLFRHGIYGADNRGSDSSRLHYICASTPWPRHFGNLVVTNFHDHAQIQQLAICILRGVGIRSAVLHDTIVVAVSNFPRYGEWTHSVGLAMSIWTLESSERRLATGSAGTNSHINANCRTRGAGDSSATNGYRSAQSAPIALFYNAFATRSIMCDVAATNPS